MLRGGPQPAGAIAAAFDVSRPAVSRHLRVLRDHGLVRDEAVGRERVYRLDVAPLAELDAWLAEFRPAWGWANRLDALETEVARARRQRAAALPDAIGRPAPPSGLATPTFPAPADSTDSTHPQERPA